MITIMMMMMIMILTLDSRLLTLDSGGRKRKPDKKKNSPGSTQGPGQITFLRSLASHHHLENPVSICHGCASLTNPEKNMCRAFHLFLESNADTPFTSACASAFNSATRDASLGHFTGSTRAETLESSADVPRRLGGLGGPNAQAVLDNDDKEEEEEEEEEEESETAGLALITRSLSAPEKRFAPPPSPLPPLSLASFASFASTRARLIPRRTRERKARPESEWRKASQSAAVDPVADRAVQRQESASTVERMEEYFRLFLMPWRE